MNSKIFAEQQVTELSIENNVLDPHLIRFIFPDFSFVKDSLASLRAEHLSIFYKGSRHWLSASTSTFPVNLRSSMKGAVLAIDSIVSGFEIVGWADETQAPAFRDLVFIDEARHVIGIGRRIPLGLFSEQLESPMALRSVPMRWCWIGFISSRYAGQRFSVSVIEPHSRSLLTLNGAFNLPHTARQ